MYDVHLAFISMEAEKRQSVQAKDFQKSKIVHYKSFFSEQWFFQSMHFRPCPVPSVGFLKKKAYKS